MQLKDNGSLEYSNEKIYHEGYKPTSTELGVVNIAGDVMTGNLVVDAGTAAEPQVGVRRSERRLYMADNGVTVGLYNVIGGSFSNMFMISRNINDGNLIVGIDGNNTVIRGAGNLKHGTADIYTTDNRPSPADIGTMTTAQINTELAKQVSKTGDTMTGNLTAPKVLLSSAQGTEVNSSTRKDYVDGLIAQQVSKTGDTMTGQLILQSTIDYPLALRSTTVGVGKSQYIVGVDSASNSRWYVGQSSGGSADVLLHSQGNSTYLRLEANQVSFNKNPVSLAPQGTTAGSLIRKDFLESSLSIQTPNGALQIGGSANLNNYQTPGFYFQDSNANAVSGSNYPTTQAGSLVVTKAAGIIQEYTVYGTGIRYIRTFYSPNWSAWAMTYDSLRPPSASAVGALPIAGGTLTDGYLQLQSATNSLLEFHQPGKHAAMIFMSNDTGQLRFSTSNGSAGETAVRMTLDTNGTLTTIGPVRGNGGVFEGSTRVYSPNNPPPRFGAAILTTGNASTKQINRGYSIYMAMVAIRGQWVSLMFTENSILTYGAVVLNMGGENADKVHSGSLTATVVNANTLQITIAGNITSIGNVYGM